MNYLVKKLVNLYNKITNPKDVKEACKKIKTETIENLLITDYKHHQKTNRTFEKIEQFVKEYNYPVKNYLIQGMIYEGLHLVLQDRGINSPIAQQLYDFNYTLYCKLR